MHFFFPNVLEAYIRHWLARTLASYFVVNLLKKTKNWRHFHRSCLCEERLKFRPVDALYSFFFFFMGIETSLKAPRRLSWSELENSLSISGAVAVTIIWGLLMLEKLPFSTAGKVCKAVSLCNCAAVCLQLCLSAAAFPSPPQFLTFWSILTTFDRGIEIFRIWSSDTFFADEWLRRDGWVPFCPSWGKGRKKLRFYPFMNDDKCVFNQHTCSFGVSTRSFFFCLCLQILWGSSKCCYCCASILGGNLEIMGRH